MFEGLGLHFGYKFIWKNLTLFDQDYFLQIYLEAYLFLLADKINL